MTITDYDDSVKCPPKKTPYNAKKRGYKPRFMHINLILRINYKFPKKTFSKAYSRKVF